MTHDQPLGAGNGGEEVIEGGAVAIGRRFVGEISQPNDSVSSTAIVRRESCTPRPVDPIPHFFIDTLQAVSNVIGKKPAVDEHGVSDHHDGQILREESLSNGAIRSQCGDSRPDTLEALIFDATK